MPVPSGFDELMPKTIANATVDRLLHHAHVVLTAGDSIRLTQATAGKGVTPLTQLSPGQFCWPRTGSSVGHQRAVLLSATGQIPLAIDTCSGLGLGLMQGDADVQTSEENP